MADTTDCRGNPGGSGLDMETARPIKTSFLHKFFRELTPKEKAVIRRALGYIPTDDLAGDYDVLWKDYEAGKVGMFGVWLDGQPRATTFYGVENFADGKKNLVSFATIANGPLAPDVQAEWDRELEKLARLYGCCSMSLRTVRPGLVERLLKNGWYASEIICRKIIK